MWVLGVLAGGVLLSFVDVGLAGVETPLRECVSEGCELWYEGG